MSKDNYMEKRVLLKIGQQYRLQRSFLDRYEHSPVEDIVKLEAIYSGTVVFSAGKLRYNASLHNLIRNIIEEPIVFAGREYETRIRESGPDTDKEPLLPKPEEDVTIPETPSEPDQPEEDTAPDSDIPQTEPDQKGDESDGSETSPEDTQPVEPKPDNPYGDDPLYDNNPYGNDYL